MSPNQSHDDVSRSTKAIVRHEAVGRRVSAPGAGSAYVRVPRDGQHSSQARCPDHRFRSRGGFHFAATYSASDVCPSSVKAS
jgi:hypothetical protein